MEGEGGGSRNQRKNVTKISGERRGSGLIRYMTEKYIILWITSQKFQCISNLLFQDSVKISKSNRSCNFMLVCNYHINIYLHFLAFETPQITTFLFKVLQFLLKLLRNEGEGGQKSNHHYEAWHRVSGGEKGFFLALRTHWVVPELCNQSFLSNSFFTI